MVIEGMKLLLQNHPNIEVAGTALSGEEAIDLLPNLCPDVVLLDINMPGSMALIPVKAFELQPILKVIAISMHKKVALLNWCFQRFQGLC